MNDQAVRTVNEWAQGFRNLYSENDDKRRPEEFWNATMAHLSCIGEAIRRSHYLELMSAAAHAFCWMCCFVSKCNETDDKLFHVENNFSEIVGLKFPKICGHCGENHCSCNPVQMDDQKDKSGKYGELYNNWKDIKWDGYSLKSWLDVFWSVYSGQIHLLAFENIGFHLLEEAGEEALAVRQLVSFRGIVNEKIEGIDDDFFDRLSNIPQLVEEYIKCIGDLKGKYRVEKDKEAIKQIDYTDDDPIVLKARIVKGKMDFVIEFADTFSWYSAVLLKLSKIIEAEDLEENVKRKFNIEEALKTIYLSETNDNPLSCYSCKEQKCRCKFYPENK